MRVGFIGLGIMGKPMCKNLLQAGYSVVCYNRSKAAVDAMAAAGGIAAGSVAELARQCAIIITMLPNSPQVREVALGAEGLSDNAAAGALLIDMSSIVPLAAREIHSSLAAKGIRMIDAPVSGGEPRAVDATLSDALIRRTGSLTLARKTPIILGMLLSTSIVLCNYVDTTALVVFFMSLSFFGKGFGALGWAVISDAAPKEISGLAGGVFNMCGNIAGILTPIAIGYIVAVTGSFHGALLYVALHAVGAMIAYLFMVGKIERLQLKA